MLSTGLRLMLKLFINRLDSSIGLLSSSKSDSITVLLNGLFFVRLFVDLLSMANLLLGDLNCKEKRGRFN